MVGPGPDLADDHDRWLALLEAAYRHDGEDPNGVYGALNGVRCCGARLASQSQGEAGAARVSWRTLPGVEISQAQWQALPTRWLLPHTAAIRALLAAQPDEPGSVAQVSATRAPGQSA